MKMQSIWKTHVNMSPNFKSNFSNSQLRSPVNTKGNKLKTTKLKSYTFERKPSIKHSILHNNILPSNSTYEIDISKNITEFVAETLLPTKRGLMKIRGYKHKVIFNN